MNISMFEYGALQSVRSAAVLIGVAPGALLLSPEGLALAECVSRFLPWLRLAGRELRGRCPFHDGDSEPLRIGAAGWRCLACGAHELHGADAAGFVALWYGIDRAAAIERIAAGALPPPLGISAQLDRYGGAAHGDKAPL